MRHLIKLALFLLAAVAAYFVYGFTAQVAPVPVAVLAAGSLVGTYIGLAFADIPRGQRRRAQTVAQVAMGIEAAYGALYVLSLQYPAFFERPPVVFAVLFALLHGAAFSILAYFVSMFVVHDRAEDDGGTPEQRVAAQVADALRPLLAPPAQPTYPRPALVDDAATQALVVPQKAARLYACPSCGQSLSQGQYGAAKKYGRCASCPPGLSGAENSPEG